MNRIKSTGLKVKENIVFPINTKYDIKVRNQTEDRRIEPYIENTHYPISKKEVYTNPNFDFAKEYEIGYFRA
jgi:hypothetical protein